MVQFFIQSRHIQVKTKVPSNDFRITMTITIPGYCTTSVRTVLLLVLYTSDNLAANIPDRDEQKTTQFPFPQRGPDGILVK
jgi:hypothetical protein